MKIQNSKQRPVLPDPHEFVPDTDRLTVASYRRLARNLISVKNNHRNGSALIMVTLSIIILSTIGLGLLGVSYGVRLKASRQRNETVAMLAAEAGYEKAIYWMSQQKDMISAIQQRIDGTNGTLTFPDGSCDYQIKFYTFFGSRPAYEVISSGRSGIFNRTVDVLVLQAVSGWDIGSCRIPTGSSSTDEVYFANNEVIDMPLHINDAQDSPDERDIYISGSPKFTKTIGMGESRYTDNSYDKYSSVMKLFDGGIYFDQPNTRISDNDSVQSKVDRFRDSTKAQYRFTPRATASVQNPNAAVQLEFFVENDIGKVRITNNCTVVGCKRDSDSKTFDFRIKPGSNGTRFERYDIYCYHYMSDYAESNGDRTTKEVEQTYTSQIIDGIESQPGGQIYVDGNVVIGGDKSEHNGDQLVKGKITVVATGNIWIADAITVDGPHDSNGLPSKDNPNILGLVAQGVIKVVDPGISSYSSSYSNGYPGPAEDIWNYEYVPIGREEESSSGGGWGWGHWGGGSSSSDNERYLPDPMVIEAAMTIGGGGWGAENVKRGSYGDRKEENGSQDQLIVRGTITEACRGVVGVIGSDGFLKYYYYDERLLEGILPGDIWMRGKYIPAPAGWRDYRN